MHLSRKAKIGAVATVAILAMAGAAFAYFTAGGGGTGSGTVGTSTDLVLVGTVEDLLYPGTESGVTFTVDNPSTGTQILTTIHLDGVTTSDVLCLGTDFTMPDVAANQSLAAATDDIVVTTAGTMTMNAAPARNQDACKNATLTLDLSST
jgi:hypothetical protein